MLAPPAPKWAAGLPDLRHLLRFDATQYICPLAINGKLVLSIVDTGAHRTVMCTGMAQELGVQVTEMANCGRFSVPGSDAIHAYAGVVKGRTSLQI